MTLQEQIIQQVEIGFSKKEIMENLVSKGFAQAEVEAELNKVQFSGDADASGGDVSVKSIVFGCIFIIAMLVRFATYNNSGSWFALIGIFSAAGMAVYFFTKKG